MPIDVDFLAENVLGVGEGSADEVKFKPGVVSGNRALALPYVDARVIQDRLDEVLGVAGWQDEYECLPDGSVVCRLRLRLGHEWITKMDVGGPSEQPDEGDRRKAAFSDALKRASVKFGVGRYLYRLAPLWVDWDAQKKKFLKDPQLPASALPKKADLRVPVPNGIVLHAIGGISSYRRPAFPASLQRRGACPLEFLGRRCQRRLQRGQRRGRPVHLVAPRHRGAVGGAAVVRVSGRRRARRATGTRAD